MRAVSCRVSTTMSLMTRLLLLLHFHAVPKALLFLSLVLYYIVLSLLRTSASCSEKHFPRSVNFMTSQCNDDDDGDDDDGGQEEEDADGLE